MLHNKALGLRYIIKGLKNQMTHSCDDETEICYNQFIGPVVDHKEKHIFYLSPFKQDQINITDFSIIDSADSNCHGHIFGLVDSLDPLKTSRQYTKEGKAILTRVKSLINLGSEIDRVYLSPFKGEYGLAIHYAEGDACYYDKSKKFNSYFFLVCDKGSLHNSPKFIGKSDNCTYIFQLSSKYGCPSCLQGEVENIKLGCINSYQNILYREDYQCIIENGDDKDLIGYEESCNDLKNIITKNTVEQDTGLKYYYSKAYVNNKPAAISFPNLKETNFTGTKNADIYVDNAKESVSCFFMQDMDRSLLLLVIILPSFYLIVTICMVVFYCKYKRVNTQYQQLRNEVEGSQSSSPRDREMVENPNDLSNP
jgi:hypothetical protein